MGGDVGPEDTPVFTQRLTDILEDTGSHVTVFG